MGLPGPRRRLGSSARGGVPLMCNVDRGRQAGCHSAQPGCGRIPRRRGPYVQPFARGGTLVACPGVMYIWGTRWRARARAHTRLHAHRRTARAHAFANPLVHAHSHTSLAHVHRCTQRARHARNARTHGTCTRACAHTRTHASSHARTHVHTHSTHSRAVRDCISVRDW